MYQNIVRQALYSLGDGHNTVEQKREGHCMLIMSLAVS